MTETTATTEITAQPILAMEVGTYVEFTDTALEGIDNPELWKGKIGVIDSYNSDKSEVWVEILNHSFDSYGRARFFKPSTLVVHPDQAAAKTLRPLLAWEARYHHQRTIIRQRDADVEALTDAITEAVEDAGYCAEYEKIVDDVNRRMSASGRSIALKHRTQEFEIDVRVQGTMYAYTTVTVEARTEDDARNMLEDDPDSFFDADDLLTDQSRNDCFDDVDVEIQ